MALKLQTASKLPGGGGGGGELPGGFVETQLSSRVSESVNLGWCMRICINISNKYPRVLILPIQGLDLRSSYIISLTPL